MPPPQIVPNMLSNSRKTGTWIVARVPPMREGVPPRLAVSELSSDPVIQAIQALQIPLHKPSTGATGVAARPKAGITIPSHDRPSRPAPVKYAQCGNRTRRRPQPKLGRLTDRDARTSNAPAWECSIQPRQCLVARLRWHESFRDLPPASTHETEGCKFPPLLPRVTARQIAKRG